MKATSSGAAANNFLGQLRDYRECGRAVVAFNDQRAALGACKVLGMKIVLAADAFLIVRIDPAVTEANLRQLASAKGVRRVEPDPSAHPDHSPE